MSKQHQLVRNVYAPIEYDKFFAEGNTIRLVIYENDNGEITLKNDIRLEHKPLLCCPHCGGEAEVHHVKIYGGILHGFVIKCKKCYCASSTQYEGEKFSFGDTPTKYLSFADALNYVVDKWNTRYEVTANA